MVLGQGALEELVKMFNNAYQHKRVLVTGHTGFKGSWLVLWLRMLGAEVAAISLPPHTSPNHWSLLGLEIASSFADIRDADLLREKIRKNRPEIVFHLAAQPLVRRSYQHPLETWAVNVMGTANLLEICRHLEGLKAVIVVTTDKCYQNKEWVWGYREIDPLGGHDPYSASKAACELVADSFRRSFYHDSAGALLATARAGNVIGGGDWSEDRLIPDLIRSITAGTCLEIRSPDATRPWQHVLECLSGYLSLGQQLLEGNSSCADAWNFGPDWEGNRLVNQVLGALKAKWPAVDWRCNGGEQPHEAQLLYLDSGKAREKLAWRPVWTFEESVAATAEWYQAWLDTGEAISIRQLQNYIRHAHERGLAWAGDLSS